MLVNVGAALTAVDRQPLAAPREGHREGGPAAGDFPGEVGVEDVLRLVKQRPVVEAHAVAYRIEHIDLGIDEGRVAAQGDAGQERVECSHVLARFKLKARHDGVGVVGEADDARRVVGDVGLDRVEDVLPEVRHREQFAGAREPFHPRVVVLDFRALEVGVAAVGQTIESIEVLEGSELAVGRTGDGLRPIDPQVQVGSHREDRTERRQHIRGSNATAGGSTQDSAARQHLGLEIGLFEAGTAHEAELRHHEQVGHGVHRGNRLRSIVTVAIEGKTRAQEGGVGEVVGSSGIGARSCVVGDELLALEVEHRVGVARHIGLIGTRVLADFVLEALLP